MIELEENKVCVWRWRCDKCGHGFNIITGDKKQPKGIIPKFCNKCGAKQNN